MNSSFCATGLLSHFSSTMAPTGGSKLAKMPNRPKAVSRSERLLST